LLFGYYPDRYFPISYNRKKTAREVNLSQNKLLNSFLADSLRQITDEDIFNSSPLLGLKILGNHRFEKAGRNIYAELNIKNGDNTSRQSLNARLNYFDRRGNLSLDSVQRTLLRNANESLSVSGRL